MALTSNAATFPCLKLSNIAPRSHLLKRMSTKHEMGILITAKGRLNSLRGGTIGLLQRPISVQPVFGPILESHEDVRAEGNFSSLRGVTALLEWLAYDQSLFDPVSEAQADVMSAKPEMNILVKATGNSSSLRGETGLRLPVRASFDPNHFNLLLLILSQRGVADETLYLDGQTGNRKWYKVLLLDHSRHTEEKVEEILPVIFRPMSAREATRLFHVSRQQGFAVVVTTEREYAEFHVREMRKYGLRAAVTPN